MAIETIYSFSAKDIKGQEVSLDDYRGEVLLIVNTASNVVLHLSLRGCSRSMRIRAWV